MQIFIENLKFLNKPWKFSLPYLFVHFSLEFFLEILSLFLDHNYKTINNLIISSSIFHFFNLPWVIVSFVFLFLYFFNVFVELLCDSLKSIFEFIDFPVTILKSSL